MRYALTTTVHPSVILDELDGPIALGANVYVHHSVTLIGPLEIGDDVTIYPGAIIGTPPEHRTEKGQGIIRIGARTTIRELVVIQRGTGERDTTIGEDCYLMHGAHVAHDCVLGDGVTLSPRVVLGGHTRVHRGATLGIGAMTHQRSTIGAFAMVGMGSVVTRDVPPGFVGVGSPARFLRMNDAALKDMSWPDLLAAFFADSRRARVESPTPWGGAL